VDVKLVLGRGTDGVGVWAGWGLYGTDCSEG
jgi:hypothetical protein